MAQNIKKKIKLVPGKGPKAEGDVKKLEFKQLHDAMQRAVAIIARSIAYSSTEARMSVTNSSSYISKVTYPSKVHKYMFSTRIQQYLTFSFLLPEGYQRRYDKQAYYQYVVLEYFNRFWWIGYVVMAHRRCPGFGIYQFALRSDLVPVIHMSFASVC
jgi:hypothetical protein